MSKDNAENDSDRAFHRLVLADGGLAKPSDMHDVKGSLASSIEQKFLGFAGYVSAAVEADASAWTNSLRLKWVANEAPNGIAVSSDQFSFIGLYLGIINRLFDSVVAIAIHPFIFENLPRSMKPSAEWGQTVSKLIRGLDIADQKEVLRMHSEIVNERTAFAKELFGSALDYIFMHELHHFWCGHLFAFDDTRRLGITIDPSMSGATLEPFLRQSLEVHADLFSIRRMFEFYALHEPSEYVKLTYSFLISTTILFMVMSPKPGLIVDWHNLHYPHPHLRFGNLLFLAEQFAKKELHLSDSDWESVFDKWLTEITRIETVTRGVNAPFVQIFPLCGGQFFDDWSSDVAKILTQYTPLFEKSRVDMLEHFRQLEALLPKDQE
jgi:hypothetical protein